MINIIIQANNSTIWFNNNIDIIDIILISFITILIFNASINIQSYYMFIIIIHIIIIINIVIQDSS